MLAIVLLMLAGTPVSPVALQGRLVDPLRAEGTVRLLPAPPNNTERRSFRFNAKPVATSPIGPKGSFHFPSVPPGKYELSWDRAVAGAFTGHALVQAPSATAVVRPSQALQLDGKVVIVGPDAALRKAKPFFAELQATPERSEYHIVEVSPEGSFAFVGLESGQYQLTVGPGGLTGAKRRLTGKLDGTSRQLEVRFGEGWTLRGKLVDAERAPSSQVVKVRELLDEGPPLERLVICSDGEVIVGDLLAEKVEVLIGGQSVLVKKGDPAFTISTH